MAQITGEKKLYGTNSKKHYTSKKIKKFKKKIEDSQTGREKDSLLPRCCNLQCLVMHWPKFDCW